MCVSVGCLDMLATDGYFTFVASQPQLACAAFVIAEPSDVISLELYDVSIDCDAGDFIKVDVTHLKKRTEMHTLPSGCGRQGIQSNSNTKFYVIVFCSWIQMVPNSVNTGSSLIWSHYPEQVWPQGFQLDLQFRKAG